MSDHGFREIVETVIRLLNRVDMTLCVERNVGGGKVINLFVIYETSYLMAPKAQLVAPPSSYLFCSLIQTLHIIPLEVKQEIFSVMTESELENERQLARGARRLCAQIIAQKLYREVTLKDLDLLPMRDKLLGPETETGKRIIGLAQRLVSEEQDSLVYVATNDDGLAVEIAYLCTHENQDIFSETVYSAFVNALQDKVDKVRESLHGPTPATPSAFPWVETT